MPNIRTLIIEDELLTAQELKSTLESQGYDVLEIVDNAKDARRALRVYQLDMVLIDIRIRGEEDGISIASHINEHHGLPVIFISSLIDAATIERAKVCKPAAYLVKPYNASELFIAMDMALFNFQSGATANPLQTNSPHDSSHYHVNEHVFIKDRYRFERVNLKDILWLKAESSYVNVVTASKSYLITTETLGSFIDKLSAPLIHRVHRSYAVNLEKVEALEGHRLIVKDQEVPISKNYLDSIQEKLRFL